MPAARRFRPFRGADAVAAGLVTRRHLSGAAWRRLFTDIYLHAAAPLDHLTWGGAAALVMPPHGALSGRWAAALYGAPAPDLPVEVTVPPPDRLRSRPNLVVWRTPLPPGDVRWVSGLPVTSPVRTAFDLARRLPLVEAVAAVDALLNRRVLRLAEFAAYSASWQQRRLRGVGQVTPVLALVCVGVESPMESRLRLLLVQAGLPTPAVQQEIYDAAGHRVRRRSSSGKGDLPTGCGAPQPRAPMRVDGAAVHSR